MQRTTLIAATVGSILLVGIGAVGLRQLPPADVDPPSDEPPDGDPTGPEAAAGDRPNVLFLVWDTVRADRMSLYGHDVPTTPKLDAWAQGATVFEHATAPAMWTLPTHSSMFTGLFPTTHGARAGYKWLDQRHVTLAELLKADGYDTFWFTSNLIAGPDTNLTQGFDTVHTTYPMKRGPGRYVADAREATRAKLIPEDASTEISPAFAGNGAEKWPKSIQKDAAPVIHRGLTEWLDERDASAGPWFAYLNFMEAHTPRLPSMSARERVMDADRIALGLATDASLFAENEFMVGKRTYTDAELAAIRGVYDAALVDLDDATADLFADLEARGILDDTLVVLVADHGEHLGENERFEHRWSVHQPLLHVPLVVRYPGGADAGRITDRVSTADLFSTILDVAGVAAPAGTQTTSLRGRQDADPYVFSQLLDPYVSQVKHVKEVYEETVDFTPLARVYCAAFEGQQKLIYASHGEHALYDLDDDPGEQTDRSGDDPDQFLALIHALYTWEQGLPVYDPSLRSKADRPKAAKGDKVEIRMLEALGYIVDEDDEDYSRTHCGPTEAP